MPTIFSLPYTIVFFFFILPSSSSSPPHSRRTLHQPLFSPAAHAPAHPPLVSFPKYPSSTNPLPFFPAFPSPPPPPPPPPASSTQTTSVPIFPATETPPTFSSPPSRRFLSQKLALAIAVPLSVIALLTISWALFTRLRHRHSGQKPSALETRRLFPGSAATATSGSVKLDGSSTGGFEYLAAAPPLLSSPELRPLPPLSHHRLRRNQDTAEIACPSSEEEFYSPRPSAEREEKSGGAAARVGSTSRRSFPSALMEKCGLPSSALSSSSRSCCPSSYSLSSPSPSSPELSPPPGNSNLPPSPFLSPSPSPPPPPPPPPPPLPAARKLPSEPPVLSSPRTMIKEEEPAVRPKLKPLHWDKVRASSDRAMVWDQLRGGSFQVDEEMMEALFAGGGGGRVAAPSPGRERRLLDPKKSQNVAILLRVLNLTKEEVCRAVVEGDAESLGSELLETLLRMAPTGEEEARLRAEPEENAFKLDPAERFLIALLRIPFAFKRLEAMLYAAKFDSEAASLRESFRILLAAGEELRGSRMLRRLLEAVLKTGNRMNVGTSRGGARAFKLDTLLKLADVKSADGKTTLLHFVVQEIARAEGARLAGGAGGAMREELQRRRTGLQVVVGLGGELSSVKRAAAMDADLLRAGAAELAGGAAKVREVLRLDEVGGKFRETMEGFLERAEEETRKVEAEESAAMAAAAATAEYFHGSSDAAAPLRIFVVVRDFLAMLEKVCREVGRANDRALMAGSPRLAQPRFSPRERKEEEDDG